MTYAVIGPGAVGTVIAYEISKVAEVTLFGRQEQQIILSSNTIDHKVNVSSLVLNDQTFDVIFVAVKVTKLAAIISSLKQMCHEETTIILCQNGMGQLDMLTDFNAVQAVVYISGQKTDQHVKHFQDKTLIVPNDETMQRISSELSVTELQLIPSDDFAQKLWFKLLVNLGINTVTSLTKNTVHILELPEMNKFIEQLIQEGIEIARAEGQSFDERTTREIMNIYKTYPKDMGTSMYYDTVAGVPLEYHYIQGELKRLAGLHNIHTPLLDICCILLEGYQYKRE
ncbi:oxidoreductase [Macrococcus lamae]|uniref:2-dehydropantoate 2-reductase n=1 Tax=Macrococcus lamae TaxID=198484 RepID=A0A4V3BEQ0_9STAP|nr:oxidoreductase [Macrococcus lamae]TDM05269.1 oxidoreductase [Macrococcus lamae]